MEIALLPFSLTSKATLDSKFLNDPITNFPIFQAADQGKENKRGQHTGSDKIMG